MANFPRFDEYMSRPATEHAAAGIISSLVEDWLDDYCSKWPSKDIIETSVGDSHYLFDVELERLIAAWKISAGRDSHERDKSRMAGFPKHEDRELYHRGHAIPHRLGGGTDINLVLQLGSINIGAFRGLEREAQATPGALYFTYWLYNDGTSQVPSSVEQGLIQPGRPANIISHAN